MAVSISGGHSRTLAQAALFATEAGNTQDVKSRAALVLVAFGWSAFWWINAGQHHFSQGSTDLAIGLTAFWLVATAIGLFRMRRDERRHG